MADEGKWITVNGHHVYLNSPGETIEKFPQTKGKQVVVEKVRRGTLREKPKQETNDYVVPKITSREQANQLVADFQKELENRQYGNRHSTIPKKHEDVYKDMKYTLDRTLKDNDIKEIVAYGGGFGAKDENFSDQNAKVLNNMQYLVKQDARRLGQRIKLGVTNDGATIRHELLVLKSLDKQIESRRKMFEERKKLKQNFYH